MVYVRISGIAASRWDLLSVLAAVVRQLSDARAACRSQVSFGQAVKFINSSSPGLSQALQFTLSLGFICQSWAYSSAAHPAWFPLGYVDNLYKATKRVLHWVMIQSTALLKAHIPRPSRIEKKTSPISLHTACHPALPVRLVHPIDAIRRAPIVLILPRIRMCHRHLREARQRRGRRHARRPVVRPPSDPSVRAHVLARDPLPCLPLPRRKVRLL